MHTDSAYDGWTAYCYPEQGMVDRLLRVHIQSQRAFGPRWTLSYNRESRHVAAARKKGADYSDEPSLKEATNSIHKDRWLEAMRDELASLIKNGVYELCSLPVGAAALTGKWVLKVKRGAQGEIERCKVRYVVRDFEQIHGQDFHET